MSWGLFRMDETADVQGVKLYAIMTDQDIVSIRYALATLASSPDSTQENCFDGCSRKLKEAADVIRKEKYNAVGTV